MRIAHLQACVLEWPPRLHGDPQGSSPLQARHPRVVGHSMPLAQFGVRVDDLRVLHQPVAEVVDDGGDGEDAAETFITSRFCDVFALLWVYLLAMASGSLSGRSRQLSVTVSRSGHLVAFIRLRNSVSSASGKPMRNGRIVASPVTAASSSVREPAVMSVICVLPFRRVEATPRWCPRPPRRRRVDAVLSLTPPNPNSHRPVDSRTGQSWDRTDGRLRSAYWGPAAAGAAGSTCSSCSREVMLSFVETFLKWDLTVRPLMNSRLPLSTLDKPSPARPASGPS